jgi:hypothetical protein
MEERRDLLRKAAVFRAAPLFESSPSCAAGLAPRTPEA